MQEPIGFVGVGRMGANMARRLKDVGLPVVAVYDTRHATAQKVAAELGCEACRSVAKVSGVAEIVLTVVSDDEAMESIYATDHSSLLNNANGRLFINCATVSPAVHVKLERRLERVGARSLEACMASSITQAREGSLYLMCGGRPETFARAKPLLEQLAATVRYVGPAGEAAKVKALVNMVMNCNTAALAEGLALGDALGLDLTTLREVFAQTGAASRVLQTDGEDMVNREHSCFFSAAHAAKDSGIALALADEGHLSLPLARATKRQYDRMVQLGLGELDKSGVAELTFRARCRSHGH